MIKIFVHLFFQFLGALKKATFDLDGQNYTFDNRGDLNTGYDIVLWKQNPASLYVHDIVASYSIQDKRITFTSESASQEVLNLTVNFFSAYFFLSFLSSLEQLCPLYFCSLPSHTSPQSIFQKFYHFIVSVLSSLSV